jgi:nucleotide-binding universal stress UspA family protein
VITASQFDDRRPALAPAAEAGNASRAAAWTRPTGRIVVGLDRSPAARAALRWAHDEARRSGRPLDVVSSRVDLEPASRDDAPDALLAVPIADRARAFQTWLVRDALDGRPADVPLQLVLAWACLPMALLGRAAARDLIVTGPNRSRRRQRHSWRALRRLGCPIVVISAPSPTSSRAPR